MGQECCLSISRFGDELNAQIFIKYGLYRGPYLDWSRPVSCLLVCDFLTFPWFVSLDFNITTVTNIFFLSKVGSCTISEAELRTLVRRLSWGSWRSRSSWRLQGHGRSIVLNGCGRAMVRKIWGQAEVFAGLPSRSRMGQIHVLFVGTVRWFVLNYEIFMIQHVRERK